MMITLLVLAAGLAVQLFVLLWARPTNLVGDEGDYAVSRKTQSAQAIWVRVPLFHFLIHRSATLGGGLWAARLLVSIGSVLSIALVVAWVEARIGTGSAVVTAGLLLFNAERAVMAIHLWPDPVLALPWCVAALMLIRDGPNAMPMLALAGAFALGLRIEGAALCFVSIAAPLLLADEPVKAAGLNAGIIGAAVAFFIMWNRASVGVWALDTTTGFNLHVARNDAVSPGESIHSIMHQTVRQRSAASQKGQRPFVMWTRWLPRVAARLRALLGPETFVTQALLATGRPGYTPSTQRALTSGPVAFLMRHWFSACFVMMLVALPYLPMEWIGLLVLAIVTYSLLVTRSRYRMALFPLVVLFAVIGWHSLLADPRPGAILVGSSLAMICLLLIRGGSELRENDL